GRERANGMSALDGSLPLLPVSKRLKFFGRETGKHEVRKLRLPGKCLGLVQSETNQLLVTGESFAELRHNGAFGFVERDDELAARSQAGFGWIERGLALAFNRLID